MSAVFIFTASSPEARKNFQKTILDGYDLSRVTGFVDGQVAARLQAASVDGKAYLWGAQEKEGGNRKTWQKMSPDDLVLGYRERKIVSAAFLVAKVDSAGLAKQVWGPNGDEPFRLIYFLTKPRECNVPVERLSEYFASEYRGFTALPAEKAEKILKDYGTFGKFVDKRLAPRAEDNGETDEPTLLLDLAAVQVQFAAALRTAHVSFGRRHDEVVRAFIASLATKPLVILTGLSGSGKTQIALRFGDWIGRERSLVIPVRPDWTGSEALFGYEDALQPAKDGRRPWSVPDALRFMLQAASDQDNPYLLVLDEMNLAHVERYFADVLSGMESERGCLPNLRPEDDGQWRLIPGRPGRIPVPRNLFIVGTVNVDETTYLFSPKVLDRANTFDFRVDSVDLAADAHKPTECSPGDPGLIRGFLTIAKDDEWHRDHPAEGVAAFEQHLKTLHSLLAEGGFEFGHRVFYEAIRFAAMLNAAGDTDPEHALDLQVMQKVLPRLHGSRRRLEPTLCALGRFCFDLSFESGSVNDTGQRFDPLAPNPGTARLPVSFDKVRRMTRGLRAQQFTSFTEQ
jgi:5-methylcytosine-specific restriction protein B